MIKTKTGLLLGIIAALFWVVADIFLVGFVPKYEKYAHFISLFPKDVDVQIAILMLESSEQRVFLGITLATFSVFLYIISTYSLFKLTKQNILSKIAIFCLFVGYCLSPLGHAIFGFIALLSKSMEAIGGELARAQISLFEQFYTLLVIHWSASVLFSAVGWFLVLILSIKKQFQAKNIFLNPIITAPTIGFLASFFPKSQIAVMLGGASLNISQLLFFIYLFIIFKND